MPIWELLNSGTPILNGVAVGRAPQPHATQGPDYWATAWAEKVVDMSTLGGRLAAKFMPDDFYRSAPSIAASGDVSATGSGNAPQVVTYGAAGVGASHVITGIGWSYSAIPAGGHIKVEDGTGNTVFSQGVAAAGPGGIAFPREKQGSSNTTMITTLAPGGSGVVGELSILGHRVV